MTNVFAWLALGVSCLSFTWQLISWRRSGARVVVHSELTVAPREFFDDEDRMLDEQGMVVVASNVGRQEVSIYMAGFKFPKQVKVTGAQRVFRMPDNDGEETLPYRLAPQAEYACWFSYRELVDFTDDEELCAATELVPIVRAGRKEIEGKFHRVVSRQGRPAHFRRPEVR
ncbi:hypothetical protein ACWEF6_15255 [Amycolatopsis sp. NPDC004772]